MRLLLTWLCVALMAVAAPAYAQDNSPDDQSIEALLLGSWDVAIREFEIDNTQVRQTDGVIHVTARLPDGTYSVLVTMSSHVSNINGGDRPIPACEGEPKCVQNSATEGIGIYSNGRFSIDYYGENWLDDVFTIKGNTMSGRDLNGPIFLTKVLR